MTAGYTGIVMRKGGHMSKWILLFIFSFVSPFLAGERAMAQIYSIEVTTIDGQRTDLSSFRGQVMLIVNVASKCGFTDQYEGLEKLYAKYSMRGFVILGFPCNQFGAQEPGTEQEIRDFCRLNYGVTFPMYSKIEVNGKNAHPLYDYLKKQYSDGTEDTDIKWNFTKFLVNPAGRVVQRFAPSKTPYEIEEHIAQLLPD